MGPGSWCCPSSGIAKPWQNLGASRALLAPSAPGVPSCGQSRHSGMENRIPHSSRRHPSASINGERAPLLTVCISPPFLATLLTGAKLNTVSLFFNRSRVASAGPRHRVGTGGNDAPRYRGEESKKPAGRRGKRRACKSLGTRAELV